MHFDAVDGTVMESYHDGMDPNPARQLLADMPMRTPTPRTERTERHEPNGRYDFVVIGDNLNRIGRAIRSECNNFYGDTDYRVTTISITGDHDIDTDGEITAYNYTAAVTTTFTVAP